MPRVKKFLLEKEHILNSRGSQSVNEKAISNVLMRFVSKRDKRREISSKEAKDTVKE